MASQIYRINNEEREQSIDFPMSRERYLSTWKIFRLVSNENVVTAKHIVALHAFQSKTSLLDLGCGDGLVISEIIRQSNTEISSVHLLDPDFQMLNEAFDNVLSLNKQIQINKWCGKVSQYFPVLNKKVEVILAIHLVYLLEEDELQSILSGLPKGVPIIFVFDDEHSVFSSLWKMTAKKYSDRSLFARNFLNSLGHSFQIKQSLITSHIANPLNYNDKIKSALISILSYSDFDQMPINLKSDVEKCITSYLKNDVLPCTSICYEIIRVN